MKTQHVKLVEVGPRDGLQNEAQLFSVPERVQLIHLLAQAGLRFIEAGSFVSPKYIPQMTNTDQVLAQLTAFPNVRYAVLVPNIQGFNTAHAAGVKEISVFTAASETFTQRNINCSIDESFERFTPVIEAAKQAGILIRGYVSCAIACPYEGLISAKKVAQISERLYQLGCYEISLGDTIGVGTIPQVKILVKEAKSLLPTDVIAVHFHDTYGQALANIYASLEMDIRIIDSSVAGLGGCPYAKGASGNVATEEVVYLLNGLGLETGVDLTKLLEASRFVSEKLNRPSRSKVAQALLG